MRNSYTAQLLQVVMRAHGRKRFAQHQVLTGTFAYLPTTVCNCFVPSVLQYSPKLQFNDENEAGMEND